MAAALLDLWVESCPLLALAVDWHRDEDILQFDPDLVIIHYSGFQQEDSSGPRERLKAFITFFADTDTEFLIYSRQQEDSLRTRMEDLLRDVDAAHPSLLDRIRVFGVIDYGARQWLSPLTSTQLKRLSRKCWVWSNLIEYSRLDIQDWIFNAPSHSNV
ncbi:MAG: hypothetical protein O7F70_09190 [Gemmatimonadetes bacterium]|nr:hypothetical protein [Gemmatimonadota bacterium]